MALLRKANTAPHLNKADMANSMADMASNKADMDRLPRLKLDTTHKVAMVNSRQGTLNSREAMAGPRQASQGRAINHNRAEVMGLQRRHVTDNYRSVLVTTEATHSAFSKAHVFVRLPRLQISAVESHHEASLD